MFGPSQHLVAGENLVFSIIYFPFVDARSFVIGNTNRLSQPDWLDSGAERKQFIRSFGKMGERHRGGIQGWPCENVVCDAKRALRFDGYPVLMRPPLPNTRLRCVFRRAWTDGKALGRFEIGLALNETSHDGFRGVNLGALVAGLFRIPVLVPNGDGTHNKSQLLEAGRSLANLYLSGTTQLDSGNLRLLERWWVQAGAPLVILEYNIRDTASLPSSSRVVKVWHESDITLSHCRVQVGGSRVGVWFMGINPKSDRDLLRRVRLNLVRLHTEREGLKLVLRMLGQRRIIAQPKWELISAMKKGFGISSEMENDPCERLQRFLQNGIELLLKKSCYGLPQIPMIDAALDFEDIVSEGERETLLVALSEARPNLRKKVAEITRESTERKQNITIIGGVTSIKEQIQINYEQNGWKSMTTQTINFGNGNVFHGDVSLNQVAAKHIQDSLNRAANSTASQDIKSALVKLSEAVVTMCKQLPPKDQERISKDLATFSNEVVSDEPRKDWYELSAKGLTQAAETLGIIAAPVIECVKTVLALMS